MQANGTLGGFIAFAMLVACMTLSVSAGLGIAVAQASSTRGSVPPLSGDLQSMYRAVHFKRPAGKNRGRYGCFWPAFLRPESSRTHPRRTIPLRHGATVFGFRVDSAFR
jgi:hypothetical protein